MHTYTSYIYFIYIYLLAIKFAMFIEENHLNSNLKIQSHWLRSLFHLLYNMAGILVSILLSFLFLKRSCRDSPIDKSFNFEGESIKVFGYQARLKTFKYSGLSLTNLQFRRSTTYRLLVWPSRKLRYPMEDSLGERSRYIVNSEIFV